METDFNVDIVDNATGEVYSEGQLLAAAHIKIAREGWKHVETTSEEIPGDGCGGGEGPFILYTLWVDTGIDLASEEEMRKRTAAWWDYENGGGQVKDRWSDTETKDFAKQLLGV